MGEGIVDGCATRSEFAQDLVCFFLIAEGVDTERGGVDFVRDADRVIEVVDCEDGHQWAEGLFHDQIVVKVVELDDCGFDEEGCFVRATAYENPAACGVQHLLEACPLSVVDDAAEVGGCADAVGVEFFEGGFHLCDEAGEDFAVDEGVILGDADLTRVDRFAP